MRFVVFGSGGMAKEVIGYLKSDGHSVDYVVSPEPFNSPAFSYYEVRERYDGGHPLLAVADPDLKRKIVAAHPDLEWTTFAHSTAFISPHASIGRGCVFAPHSLVCGDPVIGEFCFFNTNATIGHDSILGPYSTLFPNTEICGDCDIGERVIMGIGSYVIPGITLPAGTKVSAGAIVRDSVDAPCTIYGDPRGEHRIKFHDTAWVRAIPPDV